MKHIHYAHNWHDARAILENLADGMQIVFGTSNPNGQPHVQCTYLDEQAGEGVGYRVTIRRDGDGYLNTSEVHLVFVSITLSLLCREKGGLYVVYAA